MSSKLSPRKLSLHRPSITFTNVPEIDTQILLHLPDDSLESACTINKYAASLCDDNFWHQRFIQTFGVTLGKYKQPEKSYKDIYKEFVKLSLDRQLIRAAEKGYLSLVKEVLDRDADIHAPQGGDYALQRAAYNGHLEVVKLLLDRGANIHASDDEILGISSAEGHIEVVKELLYRGADIHIDDEQPLRFAAANGHLEIVKLLLDRGANINIESYQESPLSLAAGNGFLEVVKLLLDRGANIHADDDYSLQIASSRGHLEIVKLLLDRGADIHAPQGDNSAIVLAANNGHLEVVKLLFDRGSNIHARDDIVIQAAAANGKLEVVKFLIDHGADIHAPQGNEGSLRHAARHGHLEVVKLLLDHGVDIAVLEQKIPLVHKKILIKLNKIIEEYKTKKKSPTIYPIARSTEIDMPSMAELREIIRPPGGGLTVQLNYQVKG